MVILDPITLDASDPTDFPEALEYFRLQAPWISGSSWQTMANLAAARGDVVSGAAVLSMVQDVWQRMDRAVAEGQPYSEFVRDIGRSMRRDWVDIDSSRLNLIYHNNVGGALMAGRMAQIMDPDVVSGRPYLLFDAIEDFRTSEICKPLGGTILRADDPFWRTHTPLLHHRCRSTIISLDEEDAKEQGGVTPLNQVAALPRAAEGWGTTASWADWQPKGKDYAPALFGEYLAWRDGREHAQDLAEWRRRLAESWSSGLGLDPSELDKTIPATSPAPPRPARVVPLPSQKAPEAEADADLVRTYLDAWVVGSKSKKSVTLKKAAALELDLPGVAYSRVAWNIRDADVEQARPAVRQIYEQTQAALQQRYPSGRVTLYRGLRVPPPVSVVGVLESWTTDQTQAEIFAGRRGKKGKPIKGAEQRGEVLKFEVPISAVFAFSGGPNWKNGRFGEQSEYILTSSYLKGAGDYTGGVL